MKIPVCCGACLFFVSHETESTDGACRRFPPRTHVVTEGDQLIIQTHYPQVSDLEFCGLYTAKEEAKRTKERWFENTPDEEDKPPPKVQIRRLGQATSRFGSQ